MRTSLVVGGLVAALAIPALAGASPDEVEWAPNRYVAKPDKALVVFVRDRFILKSIPVLILDEEDRVVGAVKGQTYETLELAPGEHTLLLFGLDQAVQLHLRVDPFRTYVVHVELDGYLRNDLWLTPSVRGTPTFDEAKVWLGESGLTRVNPDRLEKKLNKKRKWQRRLEEAKAAEQERQRTIVDYVSRHSLAPDDGRNPAEAVQLTGP